MQYIPGLPVTQLKYVLQHTHMLTALLTESVGFPTAIAMAPKGTAHSKYASHVNAHPRNLHLAQLELRTLNYAGILNYRGLLG